MEDKLQYLGVLLQIANSSKERKRINELCDSIKEEIFIGNKVLGSLSYQDILLLYFIKYGDPSD